MAVSLAARVAVIAYESPKYICIETSFSYLPSHPRVHVSYAQESTCRPQSTALEGLCVPNGAPLVRVSGVQFTRGCQIFGQRTHEPFVWPIRAVRATSVGTRAFLLGTASKFILMNNEGCAKQPCFVRFA